jgi:hypothetical protein
MAKILISMPLTSFIRKTTREWEKPYLTKTLGGQLWLSDEAPGDVLYECDDDKNCIEFNDSCIFYRIPKEIAKVLDNVIKMKPMSYMTVREALAKIMRYEKEN